MDSQTVSSIHELPLEVCGYVLSFLPINERVRQRLLCAQFKDLIDNESVWQDLLKDQFPEEYKQLENEKDVVDWNPRWNTFMEIYKRLYLTKKERCDTCFGGRYEFLSKNLRRRGIHFIRCERCRNITLCNRSNTHLLKRAEWKQVHSFTREERRHNYKVKKYDLEEIENFKKVNISEDELQRRKIAQYGHATANMIADHNALLDFRNE
jgi:Zn-finger nucleic acid-binding protein